MRATTFVWWFTNRKKPNTWWLARDFTAAPLMVMDRTAAALQEAQAFGNKEDIPEM